MEAKNSLFADRNNHMQQQQTAVTTSSRPFLFLLLGIGIGYLITQVVLWPIIGFKSRSNHTTNRSPTEIDLTRDVRVFCFVSTKFANHKKRAKAILRTWGKRCNKLLFFTTKADHYLPNNVVLPGNVRLRESWMNTKSALKYIYDHHLMDADWFLEADDETFVVMENLRYMLYPFSRDMPIYFGSPGTVMSREALRRFVEVALPNPSKCEQQDKGPTNDRLKECLENANVVAGNTRDAKGRRRMYLIEPQARSNMYLRYDASYWFWKFLSYRTQDGIFAWSNYAVSFHYLDDRCMHMFEYMIYRLRPFGRKFVQETLPSKFISTTKDPKERSNEVKQIADDYAY
ncbi:hypothetical protein KR018_010796 [Drosophila ironensis]|nr:hypothetical protein KR018_010796 [Drosophila ironensis]